MKKTFYVIGVSNKILGLFAIVDSIMNHVAHSINSGYIPIVDLKHYQNQYFKCDREYRDNSWEYFFEQPCGCSLDDINDQDRVIISDNRFDVNIDYSILNEHTPEKHSEILEKSIIQKKEFCKNYLKFNQQTQQYLDENFSRVIGSGDDVLGVLCRGTDYIKKKPKGEQIQPEPRTVILKTKEVLKQYPNIKRIYVATEDNDIYQMFKEEFGDMLIENVQYKYSYTGLKDDYLSNVKVDRKDHSYNLAKEYLLSVYILSKCRYFIGGRTTGTKWAWIMADKWDYCYIWKLGAYGKSFMEQIFSISTEDSGLKKYKVYRFLGIKLKCRIK